jgi:hypothetical protein
MTIRFEILYRYLKVRNLLVENGYIKSNEIQKVMWNDTNHDSLLRVLPKRKTYTIKKNFLTCINERLFQDHHGSSDTFRS